MEKEAFDFTPIGGEHAISALFVVFEYKREFSGDDYEKCLKAHFEDKVLREKFPKRMKKVSTAPGEGAQDLSGEGEAKPVLGIMFSDGGGSGEGISIRLTDNKLKLVFYKYPKWSLIKSTYWDFLTRVADVFSDNPIEFLGLQVVDEFSSQVNPIYFNSFDSILNPSSQYLAPYIFNCYGPKSSEQNWMMDFQASNIETIVFHRLGIRFLPDHGVDKSLLRILHMQRVAIPKEAQPIMSDREWLTFLDLLFASNKDLTRDLLSQELRTKVGLQ